MVNGSLFLIDIPSLFWKIRVCVSIFIIPVYLSIFLLTHPTTVLFPCLRIHSYPPRRLSRYLLLPHSPNLFVDLLTDFLLILSDPSPSRLLFFQIHIQIPSIFLLFLPRVYTHNDPTLNNHHQSHLRNPFRNFSVAGRKIVLLFWKSENKNFLWDR